MFSAIHARAPGRLFPKNPLLLVSVILPFQGEGYSDSGPIAILYRAAAVRALLAHEAADYQALAGDFAPREAAIRADATLSSEEQQTQIDALLLEWAHQVISRAVHAVEWPYADPPPDPANPTTFDCWDPQVVLWIAQGGLLRAGAQWAGSLAEWFGPIGQG